MSDEEIKQILIDRYEMLLEIKAANKEENKVLERKILLTKIKLSSYDLDLEALEKTFLWFDRKEIYLWGWRIGNFRVGLEQ